MLLPSLPRSSVGLRHDVPGQLDAGERAVDHDRLVQGPDLLGEEPEGLLVLADAGDVLGDRHGAQDRAVVLDGRRGEHDRPPRAVEPLDVDHHVGGRPSVLQGLRRRPVLGLERYAGVRPVGLVRLESVDRVHRRLARPDLAQDVVARQHLAVGGHDPESDRGGLDDGAEPRRLPRQRLLGPLLLADVAERGDHALHLAVLGPDQARVHVRPDLASVLVPVAHLTAEGPFVQQRLQRVVPASCPGCPPSAGLRWVVRWPLRGSSRTTPPPPRSSR